MKNKSYFESEQSKNNTNNKSLINNNNMEYTINSSNLLTTNNLIKSKELDEKDKNIENKEKNEKSLIENKLKAKYNINKRYTKIPLNNIIIDNKFLRKNGMKKKMKHIDSDLALYQDFIIDGFKNTLYENKKNLIERLGDCIEKKYQSIDCNKINKNKYINNIKKINNINNTKNNNGNRVDKSTQKSNVFKEYKIYQKVMMGSAYNDEKKYNSVYQHSKNRINNDNINYIKERTYYNNNFGKKLKHTYSTTHLLDKKNQGDFPLLLNAPISYIKKFSSFSEKERNEKNILALLKLKHFLNIYWKDRKELVKEFFDKYNLNEEFFYEENHLENFAHFVNDNVNNNNKDLNICSIETRLPMIDIILKGIRYKPYLNIKNNINNKILNKKYKLISNNLSNSSDELGEEKDYLDLASSKYRIAKYRNFLNRNYKKSVTNKLLKGLSKEEKLKYFSKTKCGLVEIIDKNNLANNLEKQSLFSKKYNSLSNGHFNKTSIKYFGDEDLKMLNEELDLANNSVIKKFETPNDKKIEEKILGEKKFRGLNGKIIDKLNQRLYYSIKEKYHLSHPEVIPTQKKKLLEYIIVQKVQERKDFEQKFLNDLK